MGYREIGIGVMTLVWTLILACTGMPMIGDALLKIRVLLSLSLVPRNSKSDVGFGLAMLSWSRSSLRVCTTKLTKFDSDIVLCVSTR